MKINDTEIHKHFLGFLSDMQGKKGTFRELFPVGESYCGNAQFFHCFMKGQSSLMESRLLLLGVKVQWD